MSGWLIPEAVWISERYERNVRDVALPPTTMFNGCCDGFCSAGGERGRESPARPTHLIVSWIHVGQKYVLFCLMLCYVICFVMLLFALVSAHARAPSHITLLCSSEGRHLSIL